MPTTGFIEIILAAPSLWCGLAARSTVRAPRKVDRPELMIGVGAGGQRGVGQPRRYAANVPPRSIIPAHQHTRASGQMTAQKGRTHDRKRSNVAQKSSCMQGAIHT